MILKKTFSSKCLNMTGAIKYAQLENLHMDVYRKRLPHEVHSSFIKLSHVQTLKSTGARSASFDIFESSMLHMA